MEQAAITKKVLITLDILTGEMDIEHDDTNHVELLGILETAKMIVFRDFVENQE